MADTQKKGMDYINEFLDDNKSFEDKFELINNSSNKENYIDTNTEMIEALKSSETNLTNEQRNKIVELSENPMLTMAMYELKKSGIISEKQYENVKKDASYAKKYYNSLLKGLPAKKKEIDDLTSKLHRTGKKQDQLKIQEQINALENEYRAYAPLARLKNFKDATKNIKNMSTRINSLGRAFKNLFAKDDKKYLPASEYEKADSKIDQKEQENNDLDLENKYIEEGNKYIQDPKKREQWKTNVKENFEGLYGEAIIQDSLEVMAALNSGAKLEEVKKIMDKQGHSGGSAIILRDLVAKYSNRGNDFFIYTDPDKGNKENEELNEFQEPQKEQMLDPEMDFGPRDSSEWWEEEKRAPHAVRNVIAIGKKTGRKIERAKKKTNQYKEKLKQSTIVSWSDKIKETKLKAQATMAGVTKYSPEEIDEALKNGNRLTEEKLNIIKNQQAIWGRKAPEYFTQKEAEFTKQLEDEQMNRRIEAKKLLRNTDMSYEEKMAQIGKLKTEYTSRFMKVPDEYTAMENILKDAQVNTTRERKGINEKNGDIGRKTSFDQALTELNWNHDANYEKRSNVAVDGLDDFDFESELKKDYTEEELSWMEKNAKEYLDSVNERDAKKNAQEEKQKNQSKYKYKSNKKVKNMKNYKERQEKNNDAQR